MPERLENTIISVFGRKGTGKTTLVKSMIQEYPRALVIDPMLEYHDLPGAQVARGLRPALRYLVDLDGLPGERFRIVAQGLEDDEALRLMSVAWELPDHLLVVEEASLYGTALQVPPEISKLVRWGRHRRISQIYVSQRPAEVPRLVTAQSDLVVAFRQHEERDVRYLRSVYGDKADNLRHLARYSVLVFGDLERAPLALLERIARRKTVDSLEAQP